MWLRTFFQGGDGFEPRYMFFCVWQYDVFAGGGSCSVLGGVVVVMWLTLCLVVVICVYICF